MEDDKNKFYAQELDEICANIMHNFEKEERCRALNTYARIYIDKQVIPVATYLILDMAPVFKGNPTFGDLEGYIYPVESPQYLRILEDVNSWRKKELEWQDNISVLSEKD